MEDASADGVLLWQALAILATLFGGRHGRPPTDFGTSSLLDGAERDRLLLYRLQALRRGLGGNFERDGRDSGSSNGYSWILRGGPQVDAVERVSPGTQGVPRPPAIFVLTRRLFDSGVRPRQHAGQ